MNGSPIRLWLLIYSMCLLHFISCGLSARQVKIGEQFTLKLDEKVTVADTDLVIQLKGVGHQTASNPPPKDFRASYVEITITTGSAPPHTARVDDEIRVGDYTIMVKSANPFRSNDGPSCELMITRR